MKAPPIKEAELQAFVDKIAEEQLGDLGVGSVDCYGYHIVCGVFYKREVTSAGDREGWKECQEDLADQLNRRYGGLDLEFSAHTISKSGCSVHVWVNEDVYGQYHNS